LPPTPIANPGLPSMIAAAHPAKVDYLYFVAKPDRRHHFFTASAKAFDRYLVAHGYGPHP
jgi:cell division protein YceG involved in septum cleavage